MFNEFTKVLGVCVVTMYGFGLIMFLALTSEGSEPRIAFEQCLDFVILSLGVSLIIVSLVFGILKIRKEIKNKKRM